MVMLLQLVDENYDLVTCITNPKHTSILRWIFTTLVILHFQNKLYIELLGGAWCI